MKILKSDGKFRRRLLGRVEALRIAAAMSREEFVAAAGIIAGKAWTQFVAADERKAWQHLSIGVLDDIAGALDVSGTDLVHF